YSLLATRYSLLATALRFLPFIWKNLRRNPRRTALTLLSVTASLALLTMLLTVDDSMRQFTEASSRSLRISVRHKTGFALLLPISYQKQIEKVRGVEFCNPFSWYGGNFRNPREILPSVSCDPETLQQVWGDRVEAKPEEWSQFKKDRMGAMAGSLLATRYGWKAGDTVALKGTVVPVDLTFHVAGILTKSWDPQIFLFHRQYLEEAMRNPGTVGNFWVKVDHADNIPRVIREIDAMFANAPQPAIAETEKGLFQMFMGMMQMFRVVILAVGSAVVASIMLVCANTIAMSVRERMSEVGVLRAIGFRRHHVFFFLLGETCLIAMLGGLVGSTLAFLACRWSASLLPGGPVAVLMATARPHLIGWAIGISALVGGAGGFVPAFGAVRVPVSQALRQVV
ncbi:MAG: FtsX-like permease family protein, partial [Candidatus Wallbacteria bacterium]|nr:FtsX-like permease family protein [Candidatus Wallbacteria bacterium]